MDTIQPKPNLCETNATPTRLFNDTELPSRLQKRPKIQMKLDRFVVPKGQEYQPPAQLKDTDHCWTSHGIMYRVGETWISRTEGYSFVIDSFLRENNMKCAKCPLGNVRIDLAKTFIGEQEAKRLLERGLSVLSSQVGHSQL